MAMKHPVVSVVMPVRNAQRFLAEAIESVLSQTFTDFEFIIVDFGSSDDSRRIISQYAQKDDRVKLHEVGPANLPRARNAGCSLAQGRYLAVMDADDVCLPQRLKLEVDFLESHQTVAVVGGAVEWIDGQGNFLRRHDYPTRDSEIKAALRANCPFCHPTTLIRKTAFEYVEGYRASFSLAHDYDLWLRLADHFESANLQEAVLKYRIHFDQVSLSNRTLQTTCMLAAQASALARRAGESDPLTGVEEITAVLLARLGVTERERQSRTVLEFRRSIRWMCSMGEYAAALSAAVGFLRSRWPLVERWQISDLYLTVAGLYWRDGQRLNSLLAFARAILTRPITLARPLKPLLQSSATKESVEA
jgi:glycosyltransferase involved in cell wall biosynthesis